MAVRRRLRRYIRFTSLFEPGKRFRCIELTGGRRFGFSVTLWHDQDPPPWPPTIAALHRAELRHLTDAKLDEVLAEDER